MNVNDISEASLSGPTRLAIHGVEGFGKTTLAFFFPRPVFLAAENFAPRDLPWRPKRFPLLTKWEDCFSAVASLTNDQHDRETLVLDTIDWIETLIHQYVCHRDSERKSEMNKAGHKLISIEDYSYGKGYIAAAEEFRRFVRALDLLQAKRKMHIVALMHSRVKKWENPSGANFDRWQPKPHEQIARTVTEWAENVLFGFFEVVAGKLDEKDKKAKGLDTGGKRMLGAQQNALYDAKNRMNLPAVMELKDPQDMVPCLLGEHIRAEDGPRSATVSVAAEPSTSGLPEMKSDGTMKVAEPAKSEPEPEPKPMMTQPLPEGYEEPKQNAKTTPPPDKKATSKADKKTKAEPTMDDRLAAAHQLAKNYDPAFGQTVEEWIAQAKGDEKKLEKIIEHVNKTTDVKAS